MEDDLICFLQMEDDLHFISNRRKLKKKSNGRRPQQFFKWKTTSILFQKEDDPNFSNKKQSQFSSNGIQPHFSLMEDDLIFCW